MKYVSNPCKGCKNVDICKYTITSRESLEGLVIGDGSGPFTISVDCKYRVASYVISCNDLLNRVIETNKDTRPDISYKEGDSM